MSQFHFFVEFFMLVLSLFLACTKPGLCNVVLDMNGLLLNNYRPTNLNNNTHMKIKIQSRDDYQCTPDIGLHKFHTRSQTWNVARRTCVLEGGHLAIVNSKAEALLMSDLFTSAGFIKDAYEADGAWIGIHDQFSEGEWITVHDQPLDSTGFTQWSNKWGGQPDNWAGHQNCGAFLREGTLDDNKCSGTLPFFCEIPFDSQVYSC